MTVDFLRKYLRFCKRFKPRLTEETRAAIAEKYVDMRMRFQSGFQDLNSPDAKRTPRLAVTTRTLEALIRLATAHAKVRLRKHDVLPEDVDVAYRLMLEAREEEVPKKPEDAAPAEVEGDAGDGPDSDQRGVKRARDADAGTAEPIQPGRFASLRTLVARTFARLGEQQIVRGVLLESVNADLAEGEPPFTESEFTSGLDKLETQNKVMNLVETGHVMYVGC